MVPANRYYVSRPASGDYEDYWGTRVDPDGNTRERTSDAEREQYLLDNQEDIEFVWSLEPESILDVGCGPGWFLSQFTSVTRVGTEICGDAAWATATNARATVYPTTRQIPEGTVFDVVRCNHVIEHMERPELELAAIRRLMRPGGWLLIGTPDFGSPCAERFGDQYRMLHDETHCSLFTNESLHRFVRDHGFTIQRVMYPFPDRYATARTMDLFAHGHDGSRGCPPWPGNWITIYATRD